MVYVDPPLPRWRFAVGIVMTDALGVDPVTAAIRVLVFLCRLGLTVCRWIKSTHRQQVSRRIDAPIFGECRTFARRLTPKALGITSHSASCRLVPHYLTRHAPPAEPKVRCHIQLDGRDLEWKIDERMECNSNQRNNHQRLE
jgi:hypothetical protein